MRQVLILVFSGLLLFGFTAATSAQEPVPSSPGTQTAPPATDTPTDKKQNKKGHGKKKHHKKKNEQKPQ